MKRTAFDKMLCPIARSLERVGDWWNILILRDAFYGCARFEEFTESLGIAPSTLTRRLDGLVADGMLERRQYSERPPRYEYVLTKMGVDFRPVLIALITWGNDHFAKEGHAIHLVDRQTGAHLDPVFMDRKRKVPLTRENCTVAAGPAATPRMRKRFEPGAVV